MKEEKVSILDITDKDIIYIFKEIFKIDKEPPTINRETTPYDGNKRIIAKRIVDIAEYAVGIGSNGITANMSIIADPITRTYHGSDDNKAHAHVPWEVLLYIVENYKIDINE